MHYKIASAKTSKELENEVNLLIEQGYKPIGGIEIESFATKSTVQNKITVKYNIYQAMVHETKYPNANNPILPRPIRV
jgi:hypothetical protein